MNQEIKQQIEKYIGSSDVFLFMKGSPQRPLCGFSAQVSQILDSFDIKYGHFNVFEDSQIREGIKEFANWPTIPQLYVKGEFIGGCDIITELFENDELQSILTK